MGTRATQAEVWFGRAFYVETAVAYGLRAEVARVWTVKGTSGAAEVTLPDARTVLGTGWPVFLVHLTNDSTAVLLRTRGGETLKTLQPGTMTSVGLLDNSTEEGAWCFDGDADERSFLAVLHGYTIDSDVLRRFNPNASAWETGTAFTQNHRSWASTFQLGSGTYVVGDTSSGSALADRYVGASDSFLARTPRPNDAQYSPPGVDSGDGYLFSSGLTNGIDDRRTDRYNEGSDSWTSRTAIPQTCANGISGQIEAGKILAGLGRGGFGNDDGELREYNIAGDSYSSMTDHPVSNDIHHAASFTLEGRLHMVGGSVNINQAARSESYSFVVNTWTSRGAYLSEIRRAGGATDEELEKGFVCGGQNLSGSAVTTFASYVFDAFTSLPIAPDTWDGDIEHQLRAVSK